LLAQNPRSGLPTTKFLLGSLFPCSPLLNPKNLQVPRCEGFWATSFGANIHRGTQKFTGKWIKWEVVTRSNRFERLAHDFEDVALKFGKFVEKQDAVVAEGDFAGAREGTVLPAGTANRGNKAAGGMVMTPDLQRELDKGLEMMREKKYEDAKKHLEKARKLAPTNPDALYLLGMVAYLTKDVPAARKNNLRPCLKAILAMSAV
jgi:tetratricopeptide (TPR) repeat protein